jgi:hypothetical protein
VHREARLNRFYATIAYKGVLGRRQRGEKLGGKAPYGFRLAEDGVSLEECPEQQAIIRQARALRGEGCTIRQIVEKLGPVSRGGKLFTVAAVHKMVTGVDWSNWYMSPLLRYYRVCQGVYNSTIHRLPLAHILAHVLKHKLFIFAGPVLITEKIGKYRTESKENEGENNTN